MVDDRKGAGAGGDAVRRVRPWPLYALVSVAGLSAAGLVIGAVLAVPRGGGAHSPGAAGAREARGAAAAAGIAAPEGRGSTRVVWTAAAAARLRAASRARGAFVAASCAACHGPDGVGGSELAPSLAGQDAGVLWKQLEDFRSGAREWPVMNAVAQALSESDIVAVAAYLSTVEPAADSCAAPRPVPPELVARGDTRRLIPPCAACHERQNLHEVPMLAPVLEGQRADYLARQLQLFRAGWRHNDVYGHMRQVADQLTAAEVDSLTRWYALGRADRGCPR